MSRNTEQEVPQLITAGWQGITVKIPENWNIGAISGDYKAGYVRYDDEEMPRLEVKWSSEQGYVNLNTVVDKYLRELQKGRGRKNVAVDVERDIKIISKRKRKKAGLQCFRWKSAAVGYGAAWLCRDCGRTMIAQVASPGELDPDYIQEFAAEILLQIEDHPLDDWMLWSAYGLDVWVPQSFAMAKQKLMAGLIELEYVNETETVKFARWGMANIHLKKHSLSTWLQTEMGKVFRKNYATVTEATVMGHPGLIIDGIGIAGVQKIQRFYQHCIGKLYADRFTARAWYCEESNKIYYVETFVDRSNANLADELSAKIVCHPGVTPSLPVSSTETDAENAPETDVTE